MAKPITDKIREFCTLVGKDDGTMEILASEWVNEWSVVLLGKSKHAHKPYTVATISLGSNFIKSYHSQQAAIASYLNKRRQLQVQMAALMLLQKG